MFFAISLQVLPSVDPCDERQGDESAQSPPGQQDTEPEPKFALGVEDERPQDVGGAVERDTDSVVEERDLQLVRERDGRYLVDDDEQHSEGGEARPEDGHPEFEGESTSCRSSDNGESVTRVDPAVRSSATHPSSTVMNKMANVSALKYHRTNMTLPTHGAKTRHPPNEEPRSIAEMRIKGHFIGQV